MALLFMSVRTEVSWVNENAQTPVLGGIFLFLLTFIPAVLSSFLAQKFIPGLQNDIGFTKAMLLLLPGWNGFLWSKKIRLYIFFIPGWLLFGVIAIVKLVLLIAGIDDGQ